MMFWLWMAVAFVVGFVSAIVLSALMLGGLLDSFGEILRGLVRK